MDKDIFKKQLKESLGDMYIDYNDDLNDEEIEFTCCGQEITDTIREMGICPKCLEHI
jgi:hypothetical protein